MKTSFNIGLVELFKGEYALVVMILIKTNIFGHWKKCRMCGDFHLVNKQTPSNKICHAPIGGDF
jgi:hypothetical protein